MSSSVNALNSNAYYQLSNPSAGPSSDGATSTNPTSALLQDLSQSENATQSAASSEAYLLDLSPSAQQYLSGGGSANTPLNPSTGSFTLTSQQQQAITNILAKYKNAPYNQATFNAIQNDLKAAGLDPATLARIDQAKSFNPTALLIDDLNGNGSAADAMLTPDESTKEGNYMQHIISQWQTISGNTNSSSSSTASSANI